MMKKFVDDFKVLKNLRLNADNYVLTLRPPFDLPELIPGQFVEALVENSPHTFLRRPFSIHDVDYDANTISLLIKRVGEGTRYLAYLEPGDFLNLIMPLGKGFTTPENKEVLLVGGGCGVAPLLFLARWLRDAGCHPVILYGARTKDDILEVSEFKRYGKVLIITEDGSMGEQGLITRHTIFRQKNFAYGWICACGPEPMLKAVATMVEAKNVDCEVSLENTMACGIGACLCCVVDSRRGNVCVCTEGPVFNTKELKW